MERYPEKTPARTYAERREVTLQSKLIRTEETTKVHNKNKGKWVENGRGENVLKNWLLIHESRTGKKGKKKH